MTPAQYEARVLQLESEGLTTSDAQSVADVEQLYSPPRTRFATVKHSSIGLHYSIPVDPLDLKKAKAESSREFGKGFADHRIVIFDADTRDEITSRLIGSRKWTK